MHPKATREAGMATVAIAIVVSCMLLALGFLYVAKVAQAEDQGSGLQAAADAAALAGAQSIVSDIPGQIVSSIHAGKPLPGSLGQAKAVEFAGRNNATVTAYSYNPLSDRIKVTTRSKTVLIDGSYGQATAWAKTGVSIGLCTWTAPTPGPTPTPPPTPTIPPTDSDLIAKCGDLDVPITVPGAGGKPVLHIGASDLKAKFKPALAK